MLMTGQRIHYNYYRDYDPSPVPVNADYLRLWRKT